MATRLLHTIALALIATAGCQGTSRQPARPPLSFVPPAALDDTPRPKAVEAPRGTPGQAPPPSTASTGAKKASGEEESSYQFPIPPAPKGLEAESKADLPLPPAIAVGQTPAALPPAPPTPVNPATPPVTGAARSADSPSPIPAPRVPAASPPMPPPLPAPALTPVPAPAPAIPAPGAPAPAPASPQSTGPTLSLPIPVEPDPVEAKPVSRKVDPSAVNAELVAAVGGLLDAANRSYSTMNSYTMRMRRREVINGTARPEELILTKVRKEPFSVYMKWVSDAGKNREACFVKGKYEDAIHTLLAPGDIPLLPLLKQFKAAPDHPLVKSNSRYPITDAGFGPAIARFGKLVEAIEKGNSREGSARSLGKVKRPEFEEKVDGVVQMLPANYDALFPAGGQRFWYFDATHGLPVLIVTLDDQGKEVEYYCYDRIHRVANLDDDDFNPHRLWKSNNK